MNMCKWVTNSPELRTKWTEGGVEHMTETDICGNVLKVLGLVWRSEKDKFVFDQKGLLDVLKNKETQGEVCYRHQLAFLTPLTLSLHLP